MPVIPATQEAEAELLLEPRRWRLWGAKMVPLHSSLGNKSEIPSKKKKFFLNPHNSIYNNIKKNKTLRNKFSKRTVKLAGHGGSRLLSKHFGGQGGWIT